MINFKTIESMVAYCLMEWPETRNSDDILFCRVAELKHIENISLKDFFLHRAEYGMPALETIRRTRQKLQERDPIAFGASEEVEAFRSDLEDEYKQYATDFVTDLIGEFE